LERHNAGETKGNRNNRPFEIVHNGKFDTLKEARKREQYIKSQKSRIFIEKLIQDVVDSTVERPIRNREGRPDRIGAPPMCCLLKCQNIARVHAIVKGNVQGIGYRWFVQKTAQRLDLSGWVKNLDDGNVELEAEGDKKLLDDLLGFL